MKKLLIIALAGVFTFTAASFTACSEDDGTDTVTQSSDNEIAILYTNDVHCGFDNSNSCVGIAGLAAYRAVTENNYGTDNVTMIDAGDFIQGEAIGTISDGVYPIDLMNYIGYDVGTVGNHEFDYGMDELIGEGGLVEQSNMKYVACNFYYTGGTEDELVFDPYTIIEYGDISIAYIGIATPESLSKSTPSHFKDDDGNWIYGFCNGSDDGSELYTAVQNSIDAAKTDGADYVIAISHLGTLEESAPYRSYDVIGNTTGIDIVLDGHSHSVIENEIAEDKNGDNVVLTSTGTKLANIGKLVINTNGTKSTNDDVITTELVSAADVNSSTSIIQRMAYDAADSYYQSVVSRYSDTLNTVVAQSEVTLSCYYENGARAIRNSETAIGDLCTDAYRTVLDADIGFLNGGGIRADINKGDITYGDIINVQPYGNMMCVVEATGQQVIDALEHSVRYVTADAYTESNGSYVASGELAGFLQVSGIKFTVDTSITSSVVTDENENFISVSGDRRVKDVQVYNSETDSYEDIELTKTYKVASHNFMLKSAGSGYTMFQECNLIQDETMIDNQVLISYIQDYLGGTITADYVSTLTGRITITGRE